jgi:FeS assembly protein IscX
MKWIDIEEIVEMLNETYPEVNVLSLRFTDLQRRILSLEGFQDAPDKCSEKILEAIQGAWLELKNEN